MIDRPRDKKAPIIILTCIAALAVAAILIFSLIRENREAELRRKYEAVVAELERERAELLAEYSALEIDEYQKLGCSAALAMIFNGVDSVLYDTVFPIVEYCEGADGALDGIICLSNTDIPGMDGKITVAQFSEMLAAGWTAAVSWDGEGDLSDYILSMKATFASLGAPDFDTLVFLGTSYDASYDGLLIAHGIEYAVQGSGNRYPIIENRAESDGVMIPGFVGWNNPDEHGARYVYDYLYAKGGVSAFLINLPDSRDGNYRVNFSTDYTAERYGSFSRLISDYLLVKYNEDKLLVCDFDSAFEMRRNYLDILEGATPRIEAKKAELSEKINEIDRKIIEAYYDFIGT